jgi:hypothetical protein
MRLEDLCKFKKIHLLGTQTHNLPACSTVLQPTTLPRVPIIGCNCNRSANKFSHLIQNSLLLVTQTPNM